MNDPNEFARRIKTAFPGGDWEFFRATGDYRDVVAVGTSRATGRVIVEIRWEIMNRFSIRFLAARDQPIRHRSLAYGEAGWRTLPMADFQDLLDYLKDLSTLPHGL